VRLKRKLPSESVQKVRHADPDLFLSLARRCARWAADHIDKIRAARPSMPDGLHDRAEDNWEPLLAIADLAGGNWPALACEAALALSGGVDAADDTRNVQLLGDIRTVFEEDGGDRLTTAVVIERLCALEDRPWGEANRGKKITGLWLAAKLKPFGVKPKQFCADGKERGYLLDDLKDPFRRYLTDFPGRPGRTQAGCGSQPFSQPGMGSDHTGYENRSEPSPDADSTGSTAHDRGNGGGEGVSRDTGTI
jgi:putative DNA primase/helicase